MKFLLEFVWCCGASGSDNSETNASETNGRRSEEARALMAQRTLQTLTMRSRRKRGRVRSASASSGVSTEEWKPTLCSITEDNVVVVKEEGTERVVKRKGSGERGGGGSRQLAGIPTYNEDYR